MIRVHSQKKSYLVPRIVILITCRHLLYTCCKLFQLKLPFRSPKYSRRKDIGLAGVRVREILQNASSLLLNSWARKVTENSSSFRRGCLIWELRNLSCFFNLDEVILAFNNSNKDRFNFSRNFCAERQSLIEVINLSHSGISVVHSSSLSP
jgi:hypothetical protein